METYNHPSAVEPFGGANLIAVTHRISWQVPALWRLIQRGGNVSKEEMYRVFNMGIGMIAILDKGQVADFQKCIDEYRFVIGGLIEGDQKAILK